MVLGKIAENTQNDRRIMDGNELCVILRSKNLNRDPGRRASRGLLKWRDVHGALPNIGAPKRNKKKNTEKTKEKKKEKKRNQKETKTKKKWGIHERKGWKRGKEKKEIYSQIAELASN